MRAASKFGLGALLVVGMAATTFGLLTLFGPRKVATTHEPPGFPAAPLRNPVLEETPAAEPKPPEAAAPQTRPVVAEPVPRPAPAAGRRTRPPGAARRSGTPIPAPEADTTPPPLAVLAPAGHAVVTTPKLLLRVRSEAGARVTVDGRPLAENSPGLFARDLTLVPGRNELALAAEDAAGNRATARVTATFIEPARFERNKERFLGLLGQLDEIRSATAELDGRIAELLDRLRDPDQAEQVAALSAELRQIRATRRELEQEVGRAIAEIDALLARDRDLPRNGP